MHNISWGTREVPKSAADLQAEEEQKSNNDSKDKGTNHKDKKL